jgi:hypothetical protein
VSERRKRNSLAYGSKKIKATSQEVAFDRIQALNLSSQAPL